MIKPPGPYDGYLSPYAERIRALYEAGARPRDIGKALLEMGVYPKWDSIDEAAALAGMARYALIRMGIWKADVSRFKKRNEGAKPPVVKWVNRPGFQVWTPEKQWREFQRELGLAEPHEH